MPRSSRYFEIIQMLRAARKPLLAQDMANVLEVSVRTIYRDIASLQAMQTPILGEAGVGYVMRKGYDLPPLNLDVEEAEAIVLGLSMIARTGDAGLWRAAGRASRKLNDIAPGTRHLIASSWGMAEDLAVEPELIRAAIRAEAKLLILYKTEQGAESRRVIWPLAVIYYSDSVMAVAWCELRKSLRHFRLDRMAMCERTGETFEGQSADLLRQWETTQKDATVSTKAF